MDRFGRYSKIIKYLGVHLVYDRKAVISKTKSSWKSMIRKISKFKSFMNGLSKFLMIQALYKSVVLYQTMASVILGEISLKELKSLWKSAERKLLSIPSLISYQETLVLIPEEYTPAWIVRIGHKILNKMAKMDDLKLEVVSHSCKWYDNKRLTMCTLWNEEGVTALKLLNIMDSKDALLVMQINTNKFYEKTETKTIAIYTNEIKCGRQTIVWTERILILKA